MFSYRFLFSASLALLISSSAHAEDLQSLIDKAAASADKTLKLSGDYFLDKPLVLNQSHRGLTIDGQGKTRISGGRKVVGWVPDGQVWRATVDAENIEALFVNGRRASVASDGRYRYLYADSDGGRADLVTAHTDDLAQLKGLSPAELSQVYLDLYFAWCNFHAKILSVSDSGDGDSSVVKLVNPSSFSAFRWDTSPRYVICNVRSQLDEKGEYFFDADRQTLSYIPRDGENLETVEAFYPVLDCVLNAAGKSRQEPLNQVRITGITFAHGGLFPRDGETRAMQASSSSGGFVRFNYAKDIVFSGNRVEHVNTYGADLRNGIDGARIDNNEFFDCGSGGIRIGPMRGLPESETTSRVVVRNNIIWQYGRYIKEGVGILVFDSGDNIIDHNTIFDGYYSGMSIGWTWGFAKTKTQNNKITNNRIFKIGQGVLSDMGGIYTLGESSGSIIAGNEISDVTRHRYGGWGIYNDEGSQNYLITRNYVHDTQEDTYDQNYGKHNVVSNNVFTSGESSQISVGNREKKYPDKLVYVKNIIVYQSPAKVLRDDTPVSTYTAQFSHNLYWNEAGEVKFAGLDLAGWQRQYGQDMGSIIADPKLNGATPTSDVFRKIGFEPFILDAGVSGEMKQKLTGILADYEFPETLKLAIDSPWGRPYRENLSNSVIGEKPNCGSIQPAGMTNGIRVFEENGARFLRFTDTKLDAETYLPTLTYEIGVGKGRRARLTYEMRVNARSSFMIECRGETGYKGPAVDVLSGRLSLKGKMVEIPQNRWLSVELLFRPGADKAYTVKVCDGNKTLAEETVKGYSASPMVNATSLIIAQISNEDGDSFDLRKVAFSTTK